MTVKFDWHCRSLVDMMIWCHCSTSLSSSHVDNCRGGVSQTRKLSATSNKTVITCHYYVTFLDLIWKTFYMNCRTWTTSPSQTTACCTANWQTVWSIMEWMTTTSLTGSYLSPMSPTEQLHALTSPTAHSMLTICGSCFVRNVDVYGWCVKYKHKYSYFYCALYSLTDSALQKSTNTCFTAVGRQKVNTLW